MLNKPQKKKQLGIYLLLLVTPLFWGGSFGVTGNVVTEVPPITDFPNEKVHAGRRPSLDVGWK